jgi:hypothetical protein
MKTELTVSPNYSKRTFTIRKDGSKYRTNQQNKEDFQAMLNNTVNDWKEFLLKSNDYYSII